MENEKNSSRLSSSFWKIFYLTLVNFSSEVNNHALKMYMAEVMTYGLQYVFISTSLFLIFGITTSTTKKIIMLIFWNIKISLHYFIKWLLTMFLCDMLALLCIVLLLFINSKILHLELITCL